MEAALQRRGGRCSVRRRPWQLGRRTRDRAVFSRQNPRRLTADTVRGPAIPWTTQLAGKYCPRSNLYRPAQCPCRPEGDPAQSDGCKPACDDQAGGDDERGTTTAARTRDHAIIVMRSGSCAPEGKPAAGSALKIPPIINPTPNSAKDGVAPSRCQNRQQACGSTPRLTMMLNTPRG